MIVYYTKRKDENKAKGHKFIYVELTKEQAESVESNRIRESDNHLLNPRVELMNGESRIEYHLTTDGAFERYCNKRKCIPHKVYILDTIKQIKMILDPLGYTL